VATARVGVIGCGNISRVYFQQMRLYPALEVVACTDLESGKAEAAASEFGGLRALAVEELIQAPDIDIVVNLTVPNAHAQVTLAALAAGKHVYSEKPLAVSREDGRRILALAEARGLRVGCAPDTFLGGGLQTCRKLIDDGWIGRPVAAVAFMLGHGPEAWHPNPDFFYQAGGGPLFDMGPYYLTALINLLGPIRRVTGSAQISFAERTITNPARYGQKIPVQTPTHLAGVLDFESGAVATLITSFDVWSHELPCIEIYGAEGSLSLPDPNNFGGPVRLRRAGAEQWREIPLSHRADGQRGLGVADMAHALHNERPHRANDALAFHVLDAMHAIGEASAAGRHITLESRCERPSPLPLGLALGELD
jgi:predicted dehydrogenase